MTFKDFYNLSLIKEAAEAKADFAIIPGSFKPPHKGHYDMVKNYSNKANRVIVLVSSPVRDKSVRKTADGKNITPQAARQILELYVSNLPNCEVVVSPFPSPVTATYELLKEPEFAGKTVMLGASKKGNDWKGWSNAEAVLKKHGSEAILLNPEITAVEPQTNLEGTAVSASDIRQLDLSNPDNIRSIVPQHIAEDDEAIEKIIQLLNS